MDDNNLDLFSQPQELNFKDSKINLFTRPNSLTRNRNDGTTLQNNLVENYFLNSFVLSEGALTTGNQKQKR